ncbi:MAG: ammonia-forming cytochrome c nitrite reductase subunit c552 [Planctomycetota bacterium]|jgi:predicted CXXCH cytochrome family protein
MKTWPWLLLGALCLPSGVACSGGEDPETCLVKEPGSGSLPSARCAGCHQDIYREWQGSHHALAEQVLEPGAVAVEDVGPDGKLHTYPALRSIGVDPLVQYLIDLDGNLQVSQQARDFHDDSWFDTFADGRQPGEWGHWTGRGMNWDTMCAVCHNTGVERSWSMEEDRFTTTVAEHGVGCVACHGTGATDGHGIGSHEGRRTGSRVDDLRIPTAESCLPCHSRRSELAPTAGPASFFDHFDPALPDTTGIFHVDGQIHEESFEYTSFALSKMSAAGVDCLDCHDPHNGRLRQTGDALCMSCHAGSGRLEAPIIPPLPHAAHPLEAEIACIDCHMPVTVYMQRDPRHDHGFQIPDPRLTLELGVPNACNRCHQDQSPGWAAQIVEARPTWTGNSATRRRARAVHAARSGDGEAMDRLLQALEVETHSVWRATLLQLLTSWIDDPRAAEVLLAAATSEDPLIRSKAMPTPEMLTDPVRLVRLHAARAAGRSLDLQSQAGQDLLQSFLHNRGHAGSAMAEAEFLTAFGNAQAIDQVALPLTEMVARWDRSTPLPLHLRATALDRLDRRAEALVVMEECCARFPKDALSWYLLGLAAGGMGDYPQAREAFEEALRIQPDFPGATRNLHAILEFEQQR